MILDSSSTVRQQLTPVPHLFFSGIGLVSVILFCILNAYTVNHIFKARFTRENSGFGLRWSLVFVDNRMTISQHRFEMSDTFTLMCCLQSLHYMQPIKSKSRRCARTIISNCFRYGIGRKIRTLFSFRENQPNMVSSSSRSSTSS